MSAPPRTWLRVTRTHGDDLRIRVDAVDSYLPDGKGGTDVYLRGGQRVTIDLDITAALDAVLSVGRWENVH